MLDGKGNKKKKKCKACIYIMKDVAICDSMCVCVCPSSAGDKQQTGHHVRGCLFFPICKAKREAVEDKQRKKMEL